MKHILAITSLVIAAPSLASAQSPLYVDRATGNGGIRAIAPTEGLEVTSIQGNSQIITRQIQDVADNPNFQQVAIGSAAGFQALDVAGDRAAGVGAATSTGGMDGSFALSRSGGVWTQGGDLLSLAKTSGGFLPPRPLGGPNTNTYFGDCVATFSVGARTFCAVGEPEAFSANNSTTFAVGGVPSSMYLFANNRYYYQDGAVWFFDITNANGPTFAGKLYPTINASPFGVPIDQQFGDSLAVVETPLGQALMIGMPNSSVNCGVGRVGVYLTQTNAQGNLALSPVADFIPSPIDCELGFGSELATRGNWVAVTSTSHDPLLAGALVADSWTRIPRPTGVTGSGTFSEYGLGGSSPTGNEPTFIGDEAGVMYAGEWNGTAWVTTAGAQGAPMNSGTVGYVPFDGASLSVDGYGFPTAGELRLVTTDSQLLATVNYLGGVRYCTPTVLNSAMTIGTMDAMGVPLTSNGSLALTASGLPPGEFALLLASQSMSNIPLINSANNFCVNPAGRYNGQVQAASASGQVNFVVDLAAVISPNGTYTPAIGTSVYFQTYYRDSMLAPGTDFTDAIGIEIQ